MSNPDSGCGWSAPGAGGCVCDLTTAGESLYEFPEPAKQAIQWGRMKAASSASSSPFWSMAMAFQDLRDWAKGDHDADEALRGLIDVTFAAATSISERAAVTFGSDHGGTEEPFSQPPIFTSSEMGSEGGVDSGKPPRHGPPPLHPPRPGTPPWPPVTTSGDDPELPMPRTGGGQPVHAPVRHCCCIREDILIERDPGRPAALRGGGTHHTDRVFVSFVLDRGHANDNPCSLSWSEFTNRPYLPGMKACEWNDLTDDPSSVVGRVLGPAKAALRTARCPTSGGQTLLHAVEDHPHASSTPAHPMRLLVARILLHSGCDGTTVTRYWMQLITPNGSFFCPAPRTRSPRSRRF